MMNNYNNLHLPTTVRGRGRNSYYIDEFITADTETSKKEIWLDRDKLSTNSYAWVYAWSMYTQGEVFFGRDVESHINAIDKICEIYEVTENRRLRVYYHNLAYDWAYEGQFFCKKFGNPISILADSMRRPFVIKFSNGLEIYDSLKLFHKSLDSICREYHIEDENSKLHGFDYDKVRYPWTTLTPFEIKYCINDVVSLYKCIEKFLVIYKLTIGNCPETLHGIVRKEFRKYYDNDDYISFKKSQYTSESYEHLERLMSGGYTHGNRFEKGKVIRSTLERPIRHYDFASHYPTQLACREFPMTSIKISNGCTIEEFKAMKRKGYTYSFDLVFKNQIYINNNTYAPYLQISKILGNNGTYIHNDNGRLIRYDGDLFISLHELELEKVFNQYIVDDIIILAVYEHKMSKIPQFFRMAQDEFFLKKSEIKEIDLAKFDTKDCQEYIDKESELMVSKGMLNGAYGICATRYEHDNYTYNNGEWSKEVYHSIDDEINKYYRSRSHFTRFAWGVFVTMYARLQLIEMIEYIVEHNGIFHYSDTDSIFYSDDGDKIKKFFEELNAKYRDNGDNNGTYVTMSNGKRVYYNQFDDENKNGSETITAFTFLHSKCYALDYINKKGELSHKVTVAGVHGTDLEKFQALGDISNLKIGAKFPHHIVHHYIDHEITKKEIENHILYYGNSCILTEGEYTVNDIVYINDELEEYNIIPL